MAQLLSLSPSLPLSLSLPSLPPSLPLSSLPPSLSPPSAPCPYLVGITMLAYGPVVRGDDASGDSGPPEPGWNSDVNEGENRRKVVKDDAKVGVVQHRRPPKMHRQN